MKKINKAKKTINSRFFVLFGYFKTKIIFQNQIYIFIYISILLCFYIHFFESFLFFPKKTRPQQQKQNNNKKVAPPPII